MWTRTPAGGHDATDETDEITPEDASRWAVIAVAADLEFWARTVSVDGRVGLNDLVRALDEIRLSCAPETSAV